MTYKVKGRDTCCVYDFVAMMGTECNLVGWVVWYCSLWCAHEGRYAVVRLLLSRSFRGKDMHLGIASWVEVDCKQKPPVIKYSK